jgi:hypothetical protein
MHSADGVQHFRNKTQQSKNSAGTSSCSRPKIGKSTTRIQESPRHQSWPTNDFRAVPWTARFQSLFRQPCPRNVDCFSCSTSSCLFSSTNTPDEPATYSCRLSLQTSAVRPYDYSVYSNHICRDQSLGTLFT